MPHQRIIVILIIVIGLTWYLLDHYRLIRVEGVRLFVATADEPAERLRGLSGRRTVPADGLLFVYPTPDYHGIWMKEMKFPIDIVWLDANFNIIDLAENVLPETYPEVFLPKAPAQYVLELGGGEVSKLQLSGKIR